MDSRRFGRKSTREKGNRRDLHSNVEMAWVVLIGAPCGAALAQDKRPNVLLVVADDLGYGDLACSGHPEIVTPYSDSLATVCDPSNEARRRSHTRHTRIDRTDLTIRDGVIYSGF